MLAVMIATAVMIQADTRHDASLCCLGFKLRRLSAINLHVAADNSIVLCVHSESNWSGLSQFVVRFIRFD